MITPARLHEWAQLDLRNLEVAHISRCRFSHTSAHQLLQLLSYQRAPRLSRLLLPLCYFPRSLVAAFLQSRFLSSRTPFAFVDIEGGSGPVAPLLRLAASGLCEAIRCGFNLDDLTAGLAVLSDLHDTGLHRLLVSPLLTFIASPRAAPGLIACRQQLTRAWEASHSPGYSEFMQHTSRPRLLRLDFRPRVDVRPRQGCNQPRHREDAALRLGKPDPPASCVLLSGAIVPEPMAGSSCVSYVHLGVICDHCSSSQASTRAGGIDSLRSRETCIARSLLRLLSSGIHLEHLTPPRALCRVFRAGTSRPRAGVPAACSLGLRTRAARPGEAERSAARPNSRLAGTLSEVRGRPRLHTRKLHQSCQL